jgi:hypothetical protein
MSVFSRSQLITYLCVGIIGLIFLANNYPQSQPTMSSDKASANASKSEPTHTTNNEGAFDEIHAYWS